MKKEHITYIEKKLDEKGIDRELMETYSARTWLAFAKKHIAVIRRLLKVGILDGEVEFPLDAETEEYFVNTLQRLLKAKILSKEEFPQRTLLRYLQDIINQRNIRHSQIVEGILEICFICKTTIPETILYDALFFDGIRIKVLKMLIVRIGEDKVRRIVSSLGKPMERDLLEIVGKNVTVNITSSKIPSALLPVHMIN